MNPLPSRSKLILVSALSLVAGCQPNSSRSTATVPPMTRLSYPAAKTGDVVDDYHGVKVADPYRGLEDANSPDTKAFIEAQNKLVREFVAGPTREMIKARLTELLNYPRYSVPTKQGPYYIFSKNEGLQNQAVTYVTTSTEKDAPVRVLFDPNTMSKDGTIALAGESYTEDGKLVAYGVSSGGSDQKDIRIRDVSTGEDLRDEIKNVKFASVAWKHDNSGFWYNRYPAPGTVAKEDEARDNKLFWHTLGSPQDQDKLVFTPADRELSCSPSVTDDGEYLILYLGRGSANKNRLYFRKAADESAPFVRLFDAEDAAYSLVEHDGPTFYIETTCDAPRAKVVAVDTNRPEKQNWKTIVAESADTISSINCVNDRLLVTFMHDAHNVLEEYRWDGSHHAIEIPPLGAMSGPTGKRTDKETFFSFSSFTQPPTIYRSDFSGSKLSIFRQSEVKVDATQFESQQVFVKSKDGTKVPMFIVHKKGLALNGNNPTLLNAYGGFNISSLPGFSTSRVAWMENGGVVCIANLRGGGEYGEAWHQAGMLDKKQNVFDDFIACAQWLIDHKYTNNKRLAIQGGSNGGLLVAACEVQRPDLYGAVMCHVPLTDMLRYHHFSVGRFWVPEYGSADDAAQFSFIRAYSPLQNVKPGTTYPPTLIFTGEGDDRVVPLHARKFAAALQAADAGTSPILMRTETRAGHGGGKPTSKQIDETSDEYAFLARVFRMSFAR